MFLRNLKIEIFGPVTDSAPGARIWVASQEVECVLDETANSACASCLLRLSENKKVSICGSNRDLRRKLSLLLELALPDANRARRIAFVKRLLDGQKFRFAMQIGTAGNMKELFTSILGHGHKPRHGRIRRI